MSHREPPSEYVRLAQWVRDQLDGSRWPFRKECVGHLKRAGFRGERYHAHAAIKDGKPVRRSFGDAYVGFLVHLGVLPGPEGALESAAPPEADGHAWRDWPRVADALFSRYQEREECYVHNPAVEILAIAHAVVSNVGRTNGAAGDGLTDLRRGEAVMGRTAAEYARWLLAVHARDNRAVMYTVTAGGRKVGASVVFATPPGVAERFFAGELSDREMTPDDVLRNGRFLYVNAVTPFDAVRDVSAADREAAEVRCVFFQAAYFARGLKPLRPVSYMIPGNELIRERLLRFGYRPTGHVMKGTDKPVMHLRSPAESGDATATARLFYAHLRMSIRVYQWANGRQWRQEDRDRKRLGL